MDNRIIRNKMGSQYWDLDVCTEHSARVNREPLRKCPSNLTHSELEDLYFKVLQANEELKMVANGQQEKLKLLTTKLRRNSANKGTRVQGICCANRNGIIEELNNRIEDLQLVNAKLTERVRTLTLRACSAKQFMKRTVIGKSQCLQCASAMSVKHISFASILPLKHSETNVKMVSVSCQCLIEDKTKACEENKCTSEQEELKLRISELEELLSSSKSDDATIASLQRELSASRAEAARARDAAAAGRAATAERADLRKSLIAAEGACAELESRLAVERRRVAELQAAAAAAAAAARLGALLEQRLSKLPEPAPPPPPPPRASVGVSVGVSARVSAGVSVGTQCGRGPDDTAGSLARSDDSGFADPREDKKPSASDELLERVGRLARAVEAGLANTEATPAHESNSFIQKELETETCEDNLSIQHKKLWSSTPNEKQSIVRNTKIINEKSELKAEHSIVEVIEETTDEPKGADCDSRSEHTSRASNRTYVKSSLSKSPSEKSDNVDIREQTDRQSPCEDRPAHDRTDQDRTTCARTMQPDLDRKDGDREVQPDRVARDRTFQLDRTGEDRKAQDRTVRRDTTSPDNTDYDISSISDYLPDGHKRRQRAWRARSPGEASAAGAGSTTSAGAGSTTSAGECTDLSEGELPRLGRRLSKGENNREQLGATDTKVQAEETLKAIKDDLILCRRLLSYTDKINRS